jgi:hypothetical protein
VDGGKAVIVQALHQVRQAVQFFARLPCGAHRARVHLAQACAGGRAVCMRMRCWAESLGALRCCHRTGKGSHWAARDAGGSGGHQHMALTSAHALDISKLP